MSAKKKAVKKTVKKGKLVPAKKPKRKVKPKAEVPTESKSQELTLEQKVEVLGQGLGMTFTHLQEAVNELTKVKTAKLSFQIGPVGFNYEGPVSQ